MSANDARRPGDDEADAQVDGAEAEDASNASEDADAAVIADASTDGSAQDSGADATLSDAGPDAAGADAGGPDAGAPDAFAPDVGVPDAGAPDAAPDADAPDADAADADLDAQADVATGAGPADAGTDAVADPDAGPACDRPDECPGTDTDCAWRTCDHRSCGVAYATANTPVAAQSLGDCQDAVCDGQGQVSSVEDDNDVPNDGDPCTLDVCSSGVPSNPPATTGTSCGRGNVCDGNGACGP